jgi:exonuclease III
MSNSVKWNQTLKICGIAKLKSDIILLSDIRVSNKNLVSAGDDLKKAFLNNPYAKYNMHFNSTKNKRGVGILIKHDLQINILEEFRSDNENILGLRVSLHNTEVILISIYGPHTADIEFYNNLDDLLNLNSDIPAIIGGDWNCLFSTDPVQQNIDCLNMARIPNPGNSARLKEICDNHNILDPFRFLYPDKIEFSYLPRNVLNNNRSRLDFFLVSDSIIGNVSDCSISEQLQNKLFDHKAVSIEINRPAVKIEGRPTISNKELDDDLLDFVVKSTVAETYLIHCTEQQVNGTGKDMLLNICGTMKRIVRDCGPPSAYCIGSDIDPERERLRDQKINRLQILSNSLDVPVLEQLNFNAD